ncbi:hypothetical protein GW764_02845 [Candidatus Parcubacteria bacterium]|nr:hypothetical protein [Candidatus Parcubacteria bacterium]
MNQVKKIFKSNLLRVLFLATIFATGFAFTDTISAETAIERREKELREELKRLEEQQAAVQRSLDQQKSQTATIQRDVSILEDQIYSAELSIQKKNIEIQNLSQTINLKKQTIEELNEKMDRSRSALSELIKKTNDIDKTSLPEIILSNRSLTDFFADLDSYNSVQKQLEDLFDQIREIKSQTENETQELSKRQNQELDIKKEIEGEKRTIAVKKNEKDNLLGLSKQSEATYESILQQKRAEASRIRAALFQLRDTDGIPFGEAIEYAQKASRQTGVRAAFILGVLKQETDIGRIDGSCVISDLESGKTKSINYGTIFDNGIHPTRDLPILKEILPNLGRNPLDTRVSCPQSVGYGGAIGPSQFIPSTWKMFIPKLEEIFGTYPDPWIPEQAIMGTALLLRDNGAANGGYTSEFEAAGRYYAGGNWNLYGRGYANSVMSHAVEIQKQIDFLSEVE